MKQAANAGINSFNASNINIILKGTRTQLFDVPYIDKVNKLDISQSADVKIKQNMDGREAPSFWEEIWYRAETVKH